MIPLGIDALNEQNRVTLPAGETSHTQEAYAPGTILGNYFYLANKESGVEPGLLATLIDSDFCEKLAELLSKQPEPNLYKPLRDLLGTEATIQEKTEKLKTWLIKNPTEAAQLAKLCKEDKTIKRYLIKQDYADPDSKGRVTIPVRRGMNSTALIKLTPGILSGFVRRLGAKIYSYFRKRPTSEENRNALLECIGTDIASKAHGMQCQEQSVVFGTYPGGKLKILTRGTWDFGIKPLGTVHGGTVSSGNYLSTGIGKTKPYLSDDSVKDLGEYFALMLTQGDLDAVGGMAQNKFKKNGKLFGLDFGQVYRNKNPILDTLDDDFSFKQSGRIFENFSIFEDTSLREKMKGIHYIKKLLTGENPSQEILDEYGEEFTKKITGIKGGGDIEIFDRYIDKLKELSAKAVREGQKSLAAEYNALLEEVEHCKANAISTNMKILDKFEQRSSLTPTQLDILDAFEKLVSETSLTSPNGNVLLNHMRVTKRIKCEMVVSGNNCTLTLGDKKDSEKIKKSLLAYIEEHPECKELFTYTIGKSIGAFTITFNKKNAPKVAEIFNEAKIQEYKHKDKVAARKDLKTRLEQQSSQQAQALASPSLLPKKTAKTQSDLSSASRTLIALKDDELHSPTAAQITGESLQHKQQEVHGEPMVPEELTTTVASLEDSDQRAKKRL